VKNGVQNIDGRGDFGYQVNFANGVTNTFSFDVTETTVPLTLTTIIGAANANGNYFALHFCPTASCSNTGWLGSDTWSTVNGDLIASTPVPAALPLFAPGLGAMGLLGWRRKRKAAAIATA
jgi:hypothetical protein